MASNTIIPRKKCPDLETYLRQFDCHAHSFSHCVSVSRKAVPWADVDSDLDIKLHFIKNSLSSIYVLARNKGITVQAVTEHPQFKRYGIPFETYFKIFNQARAMFKGDFAAQPLGIEIELKRNEKGMYIDFEDMSDGIMDPMDIIKKLDILIFAMHDKQYRSKAAEIKNSADFVSAIKEAIYEIGELKDRMRKRNFKEKPCILAHPWEIARRLNYKKWEKDEDLREKYPEFAQYETSNDVQIGFLTGAQTKDISAVLVEAEVFPEINAKSIAAGRSDISKGRAPRNIIVQSYIEYCLEKKIDPIISIGTDDHDLTTIRNLRLDEIKAKIKNIDSAVIWCEKYLM
jgi:hypothetical protein